MFGGVEMEDEIRGLLRNVIILLTVLVVLQGVLLWRTFVLERKVSAAVSGSPRSLSELGLPVGRRAPDFEAESLQGERVSLAQMAGRPVLLVFASETCPYCRAMFPELKAFHEAYPELPVVMFLKGEPPEVLKGTDMVIVPWNEGVVRAYRVVGVPWFYLIDAEGVVQVSQPLKTLEEMNQVLSPLLVGQTPK